ncbi:flagellar biosynthetic protein FliO [Dongia sp.]|uniref:flagellar biosynthetic protein FliO n=1 Tax=Dongia sp. TaxID=1977262 RepID=UPI0035B34EB1
MDSEYLRFVLALILVLGLILLLAWALRRFGLGGMARPGGKKRLKVVDSIAAGPRHRLVLVRRDQTEHLLLLGPTGDLVIESGIAGAADAKTFERALAHSQTMAAETAPAGGLMPTLRAERPSSGDKPL